MSKKLKEVVFDWVEKWIFIPLIVICLVAALIAAVVEIPSTLFSPERIRYERYACHVASIVVAEYEDDSGRAQREVFPQYSLKCNNEKAFQGPDVLDNADELHYKIRFRQNVDCYMKLSSKSQAFGFIFGWDDWMEIAEWRRCYPASTFAHHS